MADEPARAVLQGRNRRSGWSGFGRTTFHQDLDDYYWERLGGGVHVCTCDSLLATAQARLKRQRRSTSQDWLDGLKNCSLEASNFKIFSGGHAPRPP